MQVPKLATEIYRGTYRQVNYEINKHYGLNSWWTYYIILPLNQLPEEAKVKLWLEPETSDLFGRPYASFPYLTSDLVSDIEFSGGITFYSREYLSEGTPFAVKLGCDFNHLWDESKNYSIEDIVREVEETIESVHSLIPNLLYRCEWNGKYYMKDDGVLKENGTFRSNESLAKETT